MYVCMYVYDTYVHLHMHIKTSRSHLSSVVGPVNITQKLKNRSQFFKRKEHIFNKTYYKFIVRTCKLKDNFKEPAGVKSRETYCYIFNCLGTCTRWEEKLSKEFKYTNENWLTIYCSSHTITVGKTLLIQSILLELLIDFVLSLA